MKKLIMDIGTKSLKAFVYEFVDGCVPVQAWRGKVVTTLLRFIDGGRLSEEGVDALVGFVRAILKEAGQFAPDETVAFATEWIRLIKNQDDIVSRIKAETGILIKVLSHQEEAEAYWRGIIRDFNHDGMIAAIDIGGGSVQFFWGDKNADYMVRVF